MTHKKHNAASPKKPHPVHKKQEPSMKTVFNWLIANKSHLLAIAGAIYAGANYFNNHDGTQAMAILAGCGALSALKSDHAQTVKQLGG